MQLAYMCGQGGIKKVWNKVYLQNCINHLNYGGESFFQTEHTVILTTYYDGSYQVAKMEWHY